MVLTPGLRYMLIATVFFSFMNVTVKLVPHIPAIEIVFFRSIVSFAISYLLLKGKSIPVFGNNKKLLISRGITGAIALILYFTTLQNIPLASAVTLQYLSPIFTTLLGIYLVKEKIKPLQLFFFVISFGGILMIEGFDPRLSLFYLLIGVSSAFFSGISYISSASSSKRNIHWLLFFIFHWLPHLLQVFIACFIGCNRSVGIGLF